ncbi:MAG TPA: trypsin-like serine protease [Polyangiaceae bacterium]
MKRVEFGWLWLVAAHVCGCHSEDVALGIGYDDAAASRPASAQSPAVTRSGLMDGTPSTHRDVVAVMAELGNAARLCSGVVLLPNLVLTARHCFVTDATNIEDGNCETGSIPGRHASA